MRLYLNPGNEIKIEIYKKEYIENNNQYHFILKLIKDQTSEYVELLVDKNNMISLILKRETYVYWQNTECISVSTYFHYDYPILDCLIKSSGDILDRSAHKVKIAYDPNGGYIFN